VPAAVFGVLFVLAASSDAAWVNAITRPWWNDRWRLAGAFALVACVLVGHGLAQAHQFALTVLRAVVDRTSAGGKTTRPVVHGAVGALVLVAFIGVTHVLYFDRNATKMSINTGEGPAISSEEILAMQDLAHVVPPGSRVLNDRNDGSVWMYALTGVRSVAGHYDGTGLAGTDVELLENRFNHYADDPAVRAAAARLDVQYVLVDQGFLRSYATRAPGLTDLDKAPFLTVVYRNPDAIAYRIVGTGPTASRSESTPTRR
jgi:hypothetical protein